MDDVVTQGWSIDPELATAMRLDHLRRLIQAQAWTPAILEAEELLDATPGAVEALELLGRAQLGIGDADGAVLTWEQVLALDPTATAPRLTSLATARLDICDLSGAITDAREAVRLDPGSAEAWYILGLALDLTPGRSTEATGALLTANRLDPESYPLPIQLDPAGWEQALGTAMLHVAPEVRELWDGVTVTVAERPDLDQLRQHDPPLSPRIPGNYVGTPPDDGDPWTVRPDGLALYARNLARVANLEQLIDSLADMLEHEAFVWVGEDPWADDVDVDFVEPAES
jgi:tetratricopeptide (TPR) repeat protein